MSKIINIEEEMKVSEDKGLYDSVDICADIMQRLAGEHDMSFASSSFYYIPLAVQDVINKSYE